MEGIPPPTAAPNLQDAPPEVIKALERVRDPSKEIEYEGCGGRPARDTQRSFDPRPVQMRVPNIEFSSHLEAARAQPALAKKTLLSKKNVERKHALFQKKEQQAAGLLAAEYPHDKGKDFATVVRKIREAGLDPMTYTTRNLIEYTCFPGVLLDLLGLLDLT